MKENRIKIFITILFSLIIGLSSHAQIDSKKRNLSIPAVESENDTLDASPLTKAKTVKSTGNIQGISTPQTLSKIEMPKKELSMFKKEYGNPGELYTQRIKKHENSIKNKLELGTKGSKVDVFFGDHRTKSEYVRVMYRDYGLEDGDLVRVTVNNEIIQYRVGLSNAFNGFKIKLKEGVNTIEFLALDEGYALPNTAHFRIVDDNNKIIAADLWALSINVKGTINIIKE